MAGKQVELLLYAPTHFVVDYSLIFLWVMTVGTIVTASLWQEFGTSEHLNHVFKDEFSQEVTILRKLKSSGMIHPSMATMLSVTTTDALVESVVWRKMVQVAVSCSFNQTIVDGDTSTNDTVIAFDSRLSGSNWITSMTSYEAALLQTGLNAVMQGLTKSIAWNGEGATCLIEVTVTGAKGEAEAGKIVRSVAASSLVKAAVYGRDLTWERIVAAVGYAWISFDPNNLQIRLGDIILMDGGHPLKFDNMTASNYLIKAGEAHGKVEIKIAIRDEKQPNLILGILISIMVVIQSVGVSAILQQSAQTSSLRTRMSSTGRY